MERRPSGRHYGPPAFTPAKKMSNFWADKTWTDLQAEPPRVVLLPVGSTEAHGPHLPLSTDSIISTEMARRAAAELTRQNVQTAVLPCLDYVITDFSKDFPGTISIKRQTFLAILADIADNMTDRGVEILCIVNSHLEPNHIQAITEFAQNYKRITVLFPDKTKKPWASLLTEEFKRGACHAGSYETSLVMNVREDLVRDSRLGLPENNVDLAKSMRTGVKTFREAGAPQAYFGNPAAASKEEGEQTYSVLTRMIVETVLQSMHR
jgi:creatinine amidohydrolase